MMSTARASGAEVTCATCGRRFVGVWCPDCGQEVGEPRRPVGALVRDFLGDVFAFDARVWPTLKPLFFRPGFLTDEYFAGRRRIAFEGGIANVGITSMDDSAPATEPEEEGGRSRFERWFDERVDRAGGDPGAFNAAARAGAALVAMLRF